MAKNGVEGVYTADPREDPDGGVHRRDHAHGGAPARPAGHGRSRRSTLCMENGLPIHVFNMDDERNIDRIVSGERVGTLVSDMSELTDELLADAGERMTKSVEATHDEFGSVRTGPRQPGAARPHRRRLLRRADAAQAARDDQRARGAPAHRPALRPVVDQGDREGDHGVRPRPDAQQRRQAHPPRDPRAQRGAPQASSSRSCATSPRRAASRSATSAATSCTTCASSRTTARSAPTTSTAPRSSCRSSPTRASPSSRAALKGKEAEILEV